MERSRLLGRPGTLAMAFLIAFPLALMFTPFLLIPTSDIRVYYVTAIITWVIIALIINFAIYRIELFRESKAQASSQPTDSVGPRQTLFPGLVGKRRTLVKSLLLTAPLAFVFNPFTPIAEGLSDFESGLITWPLIALPIYFTARGRRFLKNSRAQISSDSPPSLSLQIKLAAVLALLAGLPVSAIFGTLMSAFAYDDGTPSFIWIITIYAVVELVVAVPVFLLSGGIVAIVKLLRR